MRYNKKTHHSSAILMDIYKALEKTFGTESNRKSRNVAIRAAFFSTMYNSNAFTLSDIGAVCGTDHATVLWAVKRCSYGYYDKIDGHKAAVEFCIDMYNNAEMPTNATNNKKKERERNITNALKVENARLERRLESLGGDVMTLINNIKKSKRALTVIKREVNMANGYLNSLGLQKVDVSRIDFLDDCLVFNEKNDINNG